MNERDRSLVVVIASGQGRAGGALRRRFDAVRAHEPGVAEGTARGHGAGGIFITVDRPHTWSISCAYQVSVDRLVFVDAIGSSPEPQGGPGAGRLCRYAVPHRQPPGDHCGRKSGRSRLADKVDFVMIDNLAALLPSTAMPGGGVRQQLRLDHDRPLNAWSVGRGQERNGCCTIRCCPRGRYHLLAGDHGAVDRRLDAVRRTISRPILKV